MVSSCFCPMKGWVMEQVGQLNANLNSKTDAVDLLYLTLFSLNSLSNTAHLVCIQDHAGHRPSLWHCAEQEPPVPFGDTCLIGGLSQLHTWNWDHILVNPDKVLGPGRQCGQGSSQCLCWTLGITNVPSRLFQGCGPPPFGGGPHA